MIRAAVALLLLAGCTADLRSALSQEQFAAIAKSCGLPSDVTLKRQSDGTPMIVLTNSGVRAAQIDCIRAEQDRLGATADMAN